MGDIAREQIAEPTLRPDGRQSVGFGIYNRLRLNGYFVPDVAVGAIWLDGRNAD
jgi:hypothetical protein